MNNRLLCTYTYINVSTATLEAAACSGYGPASGHFIFVTSYISATNTYVLENEEYLMKLQLQFIVVPPCIFNANTYLICSEIHSSCCD